MGDHHDWRRTGGNDRNQVVLDVYAATGSFRHDVGCDGQKDWS